jgi:Skp family chaperone for outer membrane proteins
MQLSKICMGVCLFLAAQASFAAGALKVATLDLQALVITSDAGKAGMSQLEANPEYKTLRAKLDNLEAELKTLSDQGKNEGLAWSEEKQGQHREKMTKVAQERQQTMAMLNRARESVFMQLLGTMEPGIGMALEGVMSAEGIEVVLDSKAVIHKLPAADITTMVVTRLNKINAEAMEKAKAKPAEPAKKN